MASAPTLVYTMLLCSDQNIGYPETLETLETWVRSEVVQAQSKAALASVLASPSRKSLVTTDPASARPELTGKRRE